MLSSNFATRTFVGRNKIEQVNSVCPPQKQSDDMTTKPDPSTTELDATTVIDATAVGMTYEGSPPSLHDVNLQVSTGEFVSIVGPSGCGKSTLLRLIANLREPTAGSLRLNNSNGNRAPRTAFVFQEANLLPWRNVANNIRLPLELDNQLALADAKEPTSQTSVEQLIADSLNLIGLTPDDAQKLPSQLSGGMRMRVSLARALVTQPEILLLDEPFAALDDILRQQLNEELQRIWWQKKWTAVFVTHNVAEAVFQSQRVLIMSKAPGCLVDEIKVPFEYPRERSLRATPAFAKLTGDIAARLRSAAEVSP
jgi:NitT/TauT family transport system ATP-binding protein